MMARSYERKRKKYLPTTLDSLLTKVERRRKIEFNRESHLGAYRLENEMSKENENITYSIDCNIIDCLPCS